MFITKSGCRLCINSMQRGILRAHFRDVIARCVRGNTIRGKRTPVEVSVALTGLTMGLRAQDLTSFFRDFIAPPAARYCARYTTIALIISYKFIELAATNCDKTKWTIAWSLLRLILSPTLVLNYDFDRIFLIQSRYIMYVDRCCCI